MPALVSRRRFLKSTAAGLSAIAIPGMARAQLATQPPPKPIPPDQFPVAAPVSIEVNARPIPSFDTRDQLPCAVRVAGISQRADPDLAFSRLWRTVGTAAGCQRRALHFHQRQGQLVHRPHPLSGPRNDRARRRRGRPDAGARRQADHRARLVRFGVDRARRDFCLYRPGARQPAASFRFQQGLYARARRGGAAAAGGEEAAVQQGDWRRW